MERYFARFFVEVYVVGLAMLVQCFLGLGGLTSSSKLSTSDSSSLPLLLSLEADVDEVLALLKYERTSIVKSKILCMSKKLLEPLYTLPDVK